MTEVDVNSSFGIVLPYFSNEDYLFLAINSVLNQTVSNWKLLVIDDSGTGNAIGPIINSFFDKRIVYLKNKVNIGSVNTWNSGIDFFVNEDSVKFVSILHNDDLLHPEYLEQSARMHLIHPEVKIIHTNVKVIGSAGKSIFSTPDLFKKVMNLRFRKKIKINSGDNGLAAILNVNFVYCPSMSFKIDYLATNRFNPEWRMVSDVEFVSNYLRAGYPLLRIPQKLYCYRRHQSNLTSILSKNQTRFFEEIELYKNLSVGLNELGFARSSRAAKYRISINLNLLYSFFLSLLRFNFREAVSFFRILKYSVLGR